VGPPWFGVNRSLSSFHEEATFPGTRRSSMDIREALQALALWKVGLSKNSRVFLLLSALLT